jgi:hypothetical protein
MKIEIEYLIRRRRALALQLVMMAALSLTGGEIWA